MASPLNTEFNYRYLVQGVTHWEKLKVLKGFLEGRKRAAALKQVSALKYQAKLDQLSDLKASQSPNYLILELQAELIELESFQEDQAHAFELNQQEIAILEKLIAELYEQCESTRIDGYSDDQMFEANAEAEFTVKTIQQIQSEIIALGRPNPATLLNAMSCPMGLAALKQLNIIPPETQLLTESLLGDSYAPLQIACE